MAVGGRAAAVAGLLLIAGVGVVAPEAPAATDDQVARPVSVPVETVPVLGDFDSDGRRDVFWYGPGAAADRLWYGGAGGRFTTAPAAVHGSYRPLVADFGGDGPDDVLWWAPGAAGDVLWFGRGSRRFTSRWTTVDLDYQRAAVLRPETLAGSYNPYGFVAHAMGSVNGLLYSNSLEAFQRSLSRGFRATTCSWPTGRPWSPTTASRPTTASTSRSGRRPGRSWPATATGAS
jgi:hypothetical protein